MPNSLQNGQSKSFIRNDLQAAFSPAKTAIPFLESEPQKTGFSDSELRILDSLQSSTNIRTRTSEGRFGATRQRHRDVNVAQATGRLAAGTSRSPEMSNRRITPAPVPNQRTSRARSAGPRAKQGDPAPSAHYLSPGCAKSLPCNPRYYSLRNNRRNIAPFHPFTINWPKSANQRQQFQ
jgi:hypothetical protein